MKIVKMIGLTGIVLATGVAGVAQAAGERSGHMGRSGPAATFDELDLDSDGLVTETELGELAKQRFAAADTDGNGQLSPEELQTRADARQTRRVSKMMERLDANEDGELSPDELAAVRAAHGRHRGKDMVARLDTDGDNAISREEFDARKARKQR